MTREQKILASYLLAEASNIFASHGCNDVPVEAFQGTTEDERKSLERAYNEWNGTPDGNEDYRDLQHIPDSGWMDFFAELLRHGLNL